MLIPQDASCEPRERNGFSRVSLAELRRQLARPSNATDGHRQRLLDLAERLARVRALGGEFSRVGFSGAVLAALAQSPCVEAY